MATKALKSRIALAVWRRRKPAPAFYMLSVTEPYRGGSATTTWRYHYVDEATMQDRVRELQRRYDQQVIVLHTDRSIPCS